MRTLVLRRADPTVGRREYALDGDRPVISGAGVVVDEETGAPVLIQHVFPPQQLREIRQAMISRVRWDGTTPGSNEFRLSGIKNAHRTFGFTAPVPLRQRYGCARCRLDSEVPDLCGRLVDVARMAELLYEEHAPEQYARHRALVDEIDPAWRIGGGIWTSGIINHTSALPYHRDAGNLVGSWSAMLVLRRHVEGGRLHVAEYGVDLSCEDGMLCIFDGQALLHGVTPLTIRPGHAAAHRFTTVFYAKAGMRTCAAPEEEPLRAQRARTLSEERQAEEVRGR